MIPPLTEQYRTNMLKYLFLVIKATELNPTTLPGATPWLKFISSAELDTKIRYIWKGSPTTNTFTFNVILKAQHQIIRELIHRETSGSRSFFSHQQIFNSDCELIPKVGPTTWGQRAEVINMWWQKVPPISCQQVTQNIQIKNWIFGVKPTNANAVLTSESPICSLDFSGAGTAAAHLTPPARCSSGPDISWRRGLLSRLRPEKHRRSLLYRCEPVWKKETWCHLRLQTLCGGYKQKLCSSEVFVSVFTD